MVRLSLLSATSLLLLGRAAESTHNSSQFTSLTLPPTIREPGRCAMYNSCGRKSAFGGDLPCPDNELARENTDAIFLATLAQVCGEDFPAERTCCTLSQLSTLSTSLAQAEPLIATCPACRSNFRSWYCHFTCSADQSTFMQVTETQTLANGKEAVKSLDVAVAPSFGEGFYDSCKNVKFGATNGLAMDLLGGGAKDWLGFLGYMGQERALGSPFQINYPAPDALTSLDQVSTSTGSTIPYAGVPKSCADSAIDARCACPDCPDVCAVLPYVPSPAERAARHHCHVGLLSCWSFSLIILYAVALVAFVLVVGVEELWYRQAIKLGDDTEGGKVAWRNRIRNRFGSSFSSWNGSPSESGYDRLPLEDPLFSADNEHAGTSANSQGTGSDTVTPGGRSHSAGTRSHADSNASSRRAGSRNSGAYTDSPDATSTGSRTQLGAGASLIDPDADAASSPFSQPRNYALNNYLSNAFYSLGFACAKRPYLTLAFGFAVCGVVNVGWDAFKVEKDPVGLWVAKGSKTEVAKNRFDEAFGPFYRTEQIFVSVAPPLSRRAQPLVELAGEGEEVSVLAKSDWTALDKPVLSWEVLKWWEGVEQSIVSLKSAQNGYGLEDVCFSPATDPLPPADSTGCVIQSPLAYFGGSLAGVSEDTWAATLNGCAASPASCLAPSGQPINPKLVLGAIPDSDGPGVRADQARALVVTYVVKNSLDKEVLKKVEEWESALQALLKDLASPRGAARTELGLEIAYSTGVSLEGELSSATNTDVPIVVLSYVLMFVYISLNLGGSGAGVAKAVGRGVLLLAHSFVQLVKSVVAPPRTGTGTRSRTNSISLSLAGSASGLGAYVKRQVFVDSKMLLGLWGILIVLISVSTSVALFSFLGVRTTLVIAEVLPFLVLAIGVDNVFLLSAELDQQNIAAYAAQSRQGPSFGGQEEDDLLDEYDPDGLPSPEERVARALGRMGPSILLSATCETVAFALGAMVGMPAVRNFAIYAAGSVLINTALQVTLFVAAMAIDLRRVEANRIDCMPCLKLGPTTTDLGQSVAEGLVAKFVRTLYAPHLLKWRVKQFVVALFGGLFVLSLIGMRHIQLGLDQRLALPADSYLVDYFNAVDSFLDIGPPTYFVLGGDLSARTDQQKVCGRFSTCGETSLANILEAERKRPESSFLAEPPAVWLDDFLQWTNPLLEDCCRVKKRDPETFCKPEDPSGICQPCFEDKEPAWSITLEGLPEGQEFNRYLKQWLISPTDENCPLGGKAGYASAIAFNADQSKVELSHFRTFHTPLKTQADFINALAAAERVADELAKTTGREVFPYSLPYVFFAQYAHIQTTTREVLTFALASVFLLSSLLLGSWRTGACVLLSVTLTLFSVVGMMGAWNTPLNAISLVNLLIAVGIAVEFSSHIARAFMGASGGGVPFNHPQGARDRDERARAALVDVGASVFSGITLTKLVGISTLAFTSSKLLETFFVRMWLTLIVSGALHGLVLLPVLLSHGGGQGYVLTNADGDGSWMEDAIRSRYQTGEGAGFLHAEEDESSDDERY